MANDIYAKADELKIKKEDLEAGLKLDRKSTEKMINDAYAFIKGKGD